VKLHPSRASARPEGAGTMKCDRETQQPQKEERERYKCLMVPTKETATQRNGKGRKNSTPCSSGSYERRQLAEKGSKNEKDYPEKDYSWGWEETGGP